MENLQLPRTAFTFTAPGPKPPGNQMNTMRSNSYPTWNPPGPLPQLQSTAPGPYPPTTLGSDLYQKVPMSTAGNYGSEATEMPLPTTLPPSVSMGLMSEEQHQQAMRPQYNYVPSSTAPRQMPSSVQAGQDSSASVPRYVDEGRPSKMARTGGHQSVHSSGSLSNSEGASDYRYGSYTPVTHGASDVAQQSYSSATTSPLDPAPPRDVYPPAQSWTTSAPEHNSTLAYAAPDGRSYASPYDHYKGRADGSHMKPEPQQSYAGGYNSGHRGSVDAMSNYSWSNN